MLITFKTLQKKTFVIDFDVELTVKELKERIMAEKGAEYPVENQKLIYAGKLLNDDEKVSKYGVEEKKFIVVMVTKPKPPPVDSTTESGGSAQETAAEKTEPSTSGNVAGSEKSDSKPAIAAVVSTAETGSGASAVVATTDPSVSATSTTSTSSENMTAKASPSSNVPISVVPSTTAKSSTACAAQQAIPTTEASGVARESVQRPAENLQLQVADLGGGGDAQPRPGPGGDAPCLGQRPEEYAGPDGSERPLRRRPDVGGAATNEPRRGSGSATSPTDAPPARDEMHDFETALASEPQFQDYVRNIMDLGFSREQVETALRASYNNPDRAVEYLMTGIPEQLSETVGSLPQRSERPPRRATGDDPLAFLRNQPQFLQMRQVIQQNPQLLNAVFQQIGQTNPALLQLISQNQEAFVRMLNEPSGPAPTGAVPGADGVRDTGARSVTEEGGLFTPGPIQITQQDREAIERLKALGFPEHLVVQAYFACEKNENLAANFLLSQNLDE